MIGALLADLGARVGLADAVATTDDTLALRSGPLGAELSDTKQSLLQVRVGHDGRIGWAGGEAGDRDEIVAAALRSAAVGDPTPLWLPAPAALPAVRSSDESVASMGSADLRAIADHLARTMRVPNVAIDVTVERSVGTVAVGNSRAVSAEYSTSLVAIGVAALPEGATNLPYRATLVGVDRPAAAQLDQLAEEIVAATIPPEIEPASWEPSVTRVWFAPRAVRALLAPLLAGLVGPRWLDSRGTTGALDDRLTLVDDPIVAGRPGSRPIDDDGVPTRPIELLGRGRLLRPVFDAASGSRLGWPATGHSWRRGYAPPRVGFSNIRLAAGEATPAELATLAGDGLLVRNFALGPAPNPESGTFRIGVPWAYQLAGGKVVGRRNGVVLAGNVFDLLARVAAVGNDLTWIGAAELPSLVLDGVAVSAR